MEQITTCGNQEIKRNVPFPINLVNFTAEEKTISKNQIVAMAEERPKLMLATEQKIGEMFGVVASHKSQKWACQEVPTEIQKLTFSGVSANYHDSIKNMLALFASM